MTLLTSHYVLSDLKVATEPGCSGSPNMNPRDLAEPCWSSGTDLPVLLVWAAIKQDSWLLNWTAAPAVWRRGREQVRQVHVLLQGRGCADLPSMARGDASARAVANRPSAPVRTTPPASERAAKLMLPAPVCSATPGDYAPVGWGRATAQGTAPPRRCTPCPQCCAPLAGRSSGRA